MKTWIISDTHFGHKAMIEYCGRLDNFSELILKNLCIMVQPGDVLIHLGDVCIGNDADWHSKLQDNTPGVKRILVRGNHDKKSNSWYMSHGWDFVCERFKNTINGKDILFSHMPKVWDGEYDINVHGHFHNSDHRRHEPGLEKIKNGYQLLVAMEYTQNKPILLETLLKESKSL